MSLNKPGKMNKKEEETDEVEELRCTEELS